MTIEHAASAYHLTFTGTQGRPAGSGMTKKQFFSLENRLLKLIHSRAMLGEIVVAHHGQCIGADAQFHKLLVKHRIRAVIHPGHLPEKTAVIQVRPGLDTVLLPKDTIKRNEDMVNLSRSLVATPSGFLEMTRSGTWTTIRRARRKGIPATIIWPDGTVGGWS